MDHRPLILEELTWRELAALKEQIELVLIPVGATEQHGPNLAMGCDSVLARAMCENLEAEMRPRLLVTPTVSYGLSRHHMGFPGTVTLRPATLIALVRDIVASLQEHGFRRFLVVNGHGGNVAALNTACVEIKDELEPDFMALCNYYLAHDPAVDADFPDSGKGGHACGMEVSLARELSPHIVREDALEAVDPGPRAAEGATLIPLVLSGALKIPFAFNDLTRNGCLGDARKASLQYGQALVDSALAEMRQLIELAIEQYP